MGISLPENEPKKDNHHDHHHDDISNTLAKLSLNKTEPDLLDVVEKSLAKISLVISEEEEEEEEKGDKEEEEEEEEITKDDVAERRKEGNDDDVEDDKKIIDNVGLREEKTEEEEDDGVNEETEEKEKGEEEEEEEEVKDVTEKYKKLTVKKEDVDDDDDDDDKEEEEKEEEEEEEKEEKKEEEEDEEEGTKVTPIKNLGQKVNRDLVMDGVRRVSKDNDSTHTHRDTASPPGSPNTSTEDQGEEKPKLRSRGLMGLASVPLGSYELQNSVESVSVDSPSSSYSMSPAYHYDNVGINEQFQYQQSPGFHLPISPAPSSIDDGENWLQNCRLNGQQLQQQQQQYYNNNNQYIYNDHLQYNQQQQQQQLHGFLGDNNNMQFTDNNNIQFGQNVCSQIQQQQQQPSQLLYDHLRALPQQQQQQQHLQQQHQYQQQRQQQQQPQVPDECAPLQFEDSPSPLMFPDGSYSPPSSQQQQYHHQLGFQGGQLSYEPVPEVPLRGEDKLDITLVIDAFKKEILTPNTEPISKSAIAPIKQQLLESINELQPYLEAPTQQPQLQPQYLPYYQHQQLQQQHCNNLTTSTTTSSPPPPPLCDQSQLQAISSNSNLPDRNWRMVRDNNLVLKYHKEFAMRKNEHVVEMDTDGDTPTMILACHPVKKPEYAEALQAIVLRQKNVDLHCNLPVIEAVNGGKVCRKCGTSDHNAFYSSLSLKNKQGYSVLTSVIALRHPVDVIRFLLGSLRPSDLPRIFTNNDHIFTWAVELYPELQPFVTRYC